MSLDSKTRHAWRLRRCQSTFPFCYSRSRRSPFPERTHEFLSKSFQCIHMYYVHNEHAGAPKGRAGFPCHKSYIYLRKRETEKKRERERTKEPFYYRMVTLRLTRTSFVFCTVKIFSLFLSYCLLICVTFAPLMDPKNNLTRNEIYITNRKITKNITLQT